MEEWWNPGINWAWIIWLYQIRVNYQRLKDSESNPQEAPLTKLRKIWVSKSIIIATDWNQNIFLNPWVHNDILKSHWSSSEGGKELFWWAVVYNKLPPRLSSVKQFYYVSGFCISGLQQDLVWMAPWCLTPHLGGPNGWGMELSGGSFTCVSGSGGLKRLQACARLGWSTRVTAMWPLRSFWHGGVKVVGFLIRQLRAPRARILGNLLWHGHGSDKLSFLCTVLFKAVVCPPRLKMRKHRSHLLNAEEPKNLEPCFKTTTRGRLGGWVG